MTDAKDWLARVRGPEASGDLLLAYDVALQGLAEHPDDPWLAHLAALQALAAGSKDEHPDEVYYRAASEAEAALILRDLPAARDALARAAAASSDLAARATTRRQLSLICQAHGIDESVLEALAPPAVICYSGHIIAPPGARGRFPSGQEAEVAKAIA